MLLVPRTCVVQPDHEEDAIAKPVPLDDTRAVMAYVLLGDPGLGKTEAFRQQADAVGGYRVSAGDFLALDDHPELRGSTLPVFIDGLDETRAGTEDGRVPLDNIRRKLQQLGCRRFRISCRVADWLGNPDAAKLQALLPAGEKIQVFTLQPLMLADVTAILSANHDIADPQAFIAMAEQHGLTALLFNPQTLGMLATAVGPTNRWPETRHAVYAMACERLVQEHNEEHLAATRKRAPDQGRLQRAAAYLCAIQLIADLAGFTYSQSPPDRVLKLNEVPNPERLPLDEALASRLFKSIGHDVFAPVHRTVAEFLAARCLADRLQEKLTVRRARALICGMDGGIVSSMRGLASWLASMSPVARTTVIRLDPLGVLLYGDAKHFSIADKTVLMDKLGGQIAESASFRWYEWEGRPFAALITSDMQPVISLRMAESNRSENHQFLLVALLEGLFQVPPDPVLTQLVLSMIRDACLWPAVRSRALKVYLRWVGEKDPSLRKLLTDIDSGVVTDRDDELLGALLDAMYPRVLASEDLPAFFHQPKQDNLIGNYRMFWRHNLTEIEVLEVMKLLDGFAARVELRSGDTSREYAEVFGNLLARVLKDGAEEVPDERLLNWLEASCGDYTESLLENSTKQMLHEWLQARPSRYFSLLDIALNRCANDENPVRSAEGRLHRAPAPAGTAAWWLSKAQATEDEEQAKEYFTLAVPHEPGPELEKILLACEALSEARGWQDVLTDRLTCSFERWQWRLKEAVRRKERALRAAQRHDRYRARLSDFSASPVPLGLLREVAIVYEHRHYDVDGETPLERLSSFFSGDQELVEAAFTALRTTIYRDDLPSVEQTLAAAAEGKAMVLNVPALISLELAYRQDHAFLDSMSDGHLVAAMVAVLVHSVKNHDTWVAAAVASRPQCVADAVSAYLMAAMRWKIRSPHITHLFRDPSYAEVTRRCLMPMLAQFPMRARPNLRHALSDMLHVALTLPLHDELFSLIQVRLDAPKVDGPQRACWLAAGLLLDPDRYLSIAQRYLERRPPAAQYLADFLYHRREIHGTGIPQSASVLGCFIEHFAAGCSPARPLGAGWVSPSMDRAELAKRYLNELAGRPDAESAKQLERLGSLPALAEWASELRSARVAQQSVRRDATYNKPTWVQVCATLQQGAPSCPVEIAAVVNDTLEELKEQIRHSDLNLNLQYWNADSRKKPTSPRHEELCRDTLVDQLRFRLERFEIACLPETHHADGKRSDVWCTTGILGGVPIEVKRDQHSELWTATRGQLIARYSTDPRAKGYGIYLVLWFGKSAEVPRPPTGVRPQTPEELEAMLESGLSTDEKHWVTIHVLDCSVRSGK